MTEPDQDKPGGFFRGAVSRPIAALVLFITMLVIGVITYREIPLQMLPAGWSEPQLNMWVGAPNSSAGENEEKVARVIEEQLRTLSGIEEVYSRSNSSSVYFRIKFSSDQNLDIAKAEVRDRVERARPLMPTSVERVSMWSEDADQMPLGMFGILHKGNDERTDYLIDKIVVPRIEGTRGVGKIDIWGGGADSIRILLDEDRVVAQGLDISQLIQRLSSDNFTQPMGILDDGGQRILLRSDMRFETPEEIANFPIGNGLRVSDVGRVIRAKSVRNSITRIDGDYAYTGFVSRDSQVNIVEASQNLRRVLDEIEEDPRVDGELSFNIFMIPGDMVENSLLQLQETAAWGGALAMVVLFTFLRRIRLTLCVALSIPVSAVMSIAFEYFQGNSFNILTMAGVTLAIGMLVDNSVVVVENIARYHDKGNSGVKAARIGAREIALAVTLATLTTVVVFLPMMFMGDQPMLKLIFISLGQPLCVSLIFSLFVALAFLPVIAGRIIGDRSAFASGLDKLIDPILKIPARLTAYIVGGSRVVLYGIVRIMHALNRVVLHLGRFWPIRLALAGLPFYAAWSVVEMTTPALELGTLFDRSTWEPATVAFPITLYATAVIAGLLIFFGMPRWLKRSSAAPRPPEKFIPGGDSIIEMVTNLNRRLVGWTMQHRLLATGLATLCFLSILIPINNTEMAAFMQEDDIQSITFRVRFDADYRLSEASKEMSHYEKFVEDRRESFGYESWESRFDDRGGRMQMYWERPIQPEQRVEFMRELKSGLPDRPGNRINFYDDESENRNRKNVAYFLLQGPDSVTLDQIGREAIEILKGVPGLAGISSPLEDAPETLQVEIDRDMAQTMGVSPDVALNTISYTLRGWSLSRFHEEGREIPLILEFDKEKIAGIGTLRDLDVYTEEGRVPLSAFSNLVVTESERNIRRRNGQSSFQVSAEIDDPTRVMAITMAGNQALRDNLDLPRGYSLGSESDLFSQQEEETGQMLNALMLSVVLVFLLMGILFESVLLPFSVLFTIPFAILGAFWTIFLSGTPMDSMGWIGLIILAGVVVNNGIVLIDRIHRLTVAGMPRSEAVITGCSQRVRPILMTALTTVFGLLPMAISEPPTNAIAYQALAMIVAGGLIISTFFTLWVVPLAYTVLDDLSNIISSRVRWWLRPVGSRRAPNLSEIKA
ncbi:MAG: HAE1 family hydrophobic/amphiphilic exporter-1 [Planctomycetota bacterium]|jgi:HAE1 family hydrophobic/amphiphilic exporter-1